MTISAVLDTHALLTYFEREKGFLKVLDRFTDALSGDLELAMTVVNAGEILYIVRRAHGDEVADRIDSVILSLPIRLVDVDMELTRLAAEFKASGGISYADCFAAALAKREGVPVLTGDPEFEGLSKEIEIDWL